MRFMICALMSLLLTLGCSNVLGELPSSGLIHHYSFEGNALDSVGTIDGVPKGDTTFQAGYDGLSVSFDGNSDYIELPVDLVGDSPEWTISGWILIRNYDHHHSVYGEYSSTFNADTNNYITSMGTPNFGLAYDTFPPFGGNVTSETLSTEIWTHFAVVRDNGLVLIYLDGLPSGFGTYEPYTGIPTTFAAFGARLESEGSVYDVVSGNNNPEIYSMDGMLDEIRIYDRALTESEIATLAGVESDSDQDGIDDEQDACPETESGAVVDDNGCSLDQICPCMEFKNHGRYVSCITRAGEDFVQQNLLTRSDVALIITTAAQSQCSKAH